MIDDVVTERQYEIQARAIVCRAYAQALEHHLLDVGGHILAREYAARIVDHQSAIERSIADLVARCQSIGGRR